MSLNANAQQLTEDIMPISKTSISWPPELKEEVRTLIQLLFSLLDSRDPHIGKRLAQDVFTQDGRFYSSTGYYQGQDIAISRVAAWENFEVRRHELRKVYANSTDCLDLFIVGIATVKPNGRDQETLEFIVRTVVQDTSEGLRIKYFQPLIPNPSNQPILADVQK